MTSRDNPSFLNTHVRNLKTEEDEQINVGEAGPTQLTAVSPNEENFVYVRMFANTYITGFVKHGNEEIPLTPDHEKVHVTHNTVFTDDETIYFVTDYESEYAYLAKFDLNSRKFETVLQIEEESISSLKWDKDRKQFYVVTVKGVIDILYVYNIYTEKLLDLIISIDIFFNNNVV